MIIGLDFDGTITTNAYPDVGADLGAFPWLLEAQEKGARFILFTMRDGPELEAAADYLIGNGVKLMGANVNPTQWSWTMSPKPYCHLYVDDNSLGAPIREDRALDWSVAGPLLIDAVDNWQRRHPNHLKLDRGGRYAGKCAEGPGEHDEANQSNSTDEGGRSTADRPDTPGVLDRG